ncbi:MAG TPA: GDP-mannose 4,6-dehydratase, partial [Treponemataceae bacterium]|nr:GDP-mannose 4,6-dehydratase [Treponemataceae bacterium]
MSRTLKNILVTGGAGFIGCNFIHYMLSPSSNFTGNIINLDVLTYCGNLESLSDIDAEHGAKGSGRYTFVQGDICDRNLVDSILKQYNIDTIVHFAAESHVDRSIHGPEAFVKTNVMGTFTLLDAVRNYWKNDDGSM